MTKTAAPINITVGRIQQLLRSHPYQLETFTGAITLRTEWNRNKKLVETQLKALVREAQSIKDLVRFNIESRSGFYRGVIEFEDKDFIRRQKLRVVQAVDTSPKVIYSLQRAVLAQLQRMAASGELPNFLRRLREEEEDCYKKISVAFLTAYYNGWQLGHPLPQQDLQALAKILPEDYGTLELLKNALKQRIARVQRVKVEIAIRKIIVEIRKRLHKSKYELKQQNIGGKEYLKLRWRLDKVMDELKDIESGYDGSKSKHAALQRVAGMLKKYITIKGGPYDTFEGQVYLEKTDHRKKELVVAVSVYGKKLYFLTKEDGTYIKTLKSPYDVIASMQVEDVGNPLLDPLKNLQALSDLVALVVIRCKYEDYIPLCQHFYHSLEKAEQILMKTSIAPAEQEAVKTLNAELKSATIFLQKWFAYGLRSLPNKLWQWGPKQQANFQKMVKHLVQAQERRLPKLRAALLPLLDDNERNQYNQTMQILPSRNSTQFVLRAKLSKERWLKLTSPQYEKFFLKPPLYFQEKLKVML